MTRMDVVGAPSPWDHVPGRHRRVHPLFGYLPVFSRLYPVIILCCVGYALGTAGGQRVQRGLGALVGLLDDRHRERGARRDDHPEPGRQMWASLSFFGGLVEGSGSSSVQSSLPPVNAETITAVAMLLSAYGTLVACLLVTTFVPASSLVPASVILSSD